MLPEKKWLIVFVVLSLLNPLYYVFSMLTTPYVFTGGWDDANLLTTMHSVNWNLQSPWIIENINYGDVLHGAGVFGPPFIFIPLGILALLLSIDPFIIYLIAKFVFSFLFLLVAYNFFKFIEKKLKIDANINMFVYVFCAGLGGLFYLIFMIFFDPTNILTPHPMRGFGISAFRYLEYIYYPLGLATAMLSIIYIMKNKTIISGIFLGLTALFYPLYGFATFVILFIYKIIFKNNFIKTILTLIIILGIFALPWIILYQQPYFLNLYSAAMRTGTGIEFLPTLLVGIIIPLFFILFNKINFKKDVIMIVLWIISIILYSIGQLTQTTWVDVGLRSIKDYCLLFELPLLLLLIKILYSTWFEENKEKKFIYVTTIVFAILCLAPNHLVFWMPGKILTFFWIPLSISTAMGIIEFSKKYKISVRKILSVIFILILPTLFFFYCFMYNAPQTLNFYGFKKDVYSFGFPREEFDAMNFLKTQPDGVVLASHEIGTWLPVFSNKKTLLGSYTELDVLNYTQKLSDYEKFYSQPSKEILKKYNITYVFYGYNEMKFNSTINFESLSYLEKIYQNNNIKIFKVIDRT